MPPYGPKWPAASGSEYCAHSGGKPCIFTAYVPYEFDDLRRVLDPAARFDSRRNIHGPGPHFPYRTPDVRGIEAAGEDDRDREVAGDRRPIECPSCSSRLTRDVGVEQQRARCGKSTCIF